MIERREKKNPRLWYDGIRSLYWMKNHSGCCYCGRAFVYNTIQDYVGLYNG